MTLIICYALKCVCWLGLRLSLFQFAAGLRMKDMVLGELRFFLPWTAFHVRRRRIPALTPQQPQGHASSRTCRLAVGRLVDGRLARLASLGSLGGRLWTCRWKTVAVLTPNSECDERSSSSRFARPVRRQPPRSPRFARLARRPALDTQVGNRSATYS